MGNSKAGIGEYIKVKNQSSQRDLLTSASNRLITKTRDSFGNAEKYNKLPK